MKKRFMPKRITTTLIAFTMLLSGIGLYPLNVNAASFGSEEFLTRFYSDVLERVPDEPGMQFWKTHLDEDTATGKDVAEGFLHSTEFSRREPSNEEFVAAAYRAMMSGGGGIEELSHWQSYLDNGAELRHVFGVMLKSDTFGEICTLYGVRHRDETTADRVEALVDRLYKNVKLSDPGAIILQSRAEKLINGTESASDMATSFFTSEAFKNREMYHDEYLDILYRTLFDRQPDESGMDYWLIVLDEESTDRLDTLGYFIQSQEFNDICESLGIIRYNISPSAYRMMK